MQMAIISMFVPFPCGLNPNYIIWRKIAFLWSTLLYTLCCSYPFKPDWKRSFCILIWSHILLGLTAFNGLERTIKVTKEGKACAESHAQLSLIVSHGLALRFLWLLLLRIMQLGFPKIFHGHTHCSKLKFFLLSVLSFDYFLQRHRPGKTLL